MNKKEVISRLRKSQQSTDKKSTELGDAAGREWVSDYASAIELRRLERALAGEDSLEFCGGYDRFAAERFVSIVEGEHEGAANAAAEFWEMFSNSSEMPKASYVAGFAAGAMEVWNEVKGE